MVNIHMAHQKYTKYLPYKHIGSEQGHLYRDFEETPQDDELILQILAFEDKMQAEQELSLGNDCF